ncbi:DUF2652 domain-containing protein [Paraflavisolibacter sp. H34]|uniref:DUF2652 domain-containing protein n=1 Tax=Huijunlia imazamoxiresistens TaxID=3127457 RepID=UPI0030187899
MENRGLLFIPDISGFTRFVTEAEIEHSRLVIQELLEVLMNANDLGLEVSEVEGDAILFYRFGAEPSLQELYRQVEKMFIAFHRSLVAYERRKYCQCAACRAAVDLTLKVICHYGEFTGYSVRQFHKLIGKDVIVAHQLLKNDIEQHEYWLVTDSLLHDPPPAFARWMQWNSSSRQTESGEIPFRYTQLGPLKDELPPEPLPQTDLDQKAKVLTLSREYDTDLITLFHATGDFRYRHRWVEGVQRVEEVEHLLPRVGMRCRYILADGEVGYYSSSYAYQPDRIAFCETDDRNQNVLCFTLEQGGPARSKLTVEVYHPKNALRQFLFRLVGQTKAEASWRRSLERLAALLPEVL